MGTLTSLQVPSRRRAVGAAVLAAALVGAVPADEAAWAAEPGFEGRRAPTASLARTPLDFRDAMRQLVIRFAENARASRPGFQIVVQDGLELIAKNADPTTPANAPARRYLRSIDGILVGATPPTEELATRQQTLLRLARDHGKAVFAIGDAIPAGAAGMIAAPPIPADAGGPPSQALTARPTGENPANIAALAEAKNFLPVFAHRPFGGTVREHALALHATNYDVLMLDPFFGRDPLPTQAIALLRYKRLGARRRVLAVIDVGHASGDRYYWRDGWRAGLPPFLAAPVDGEAEVYYVAYWSPAWQALIAGETDSTLAGILAQGFDGAVLAGAGAYQYFEGGSGIGARLRPVSPARLPTPEPVERDL